MKTITSANVSEFSTKELVAFYNANADHFGKKQITKFADRATAELRVRMMAEDLEAEAAAEVKEAAPVAKVQPEAKNCYDYAVDGCPTCKATEDQTAAGLDGTQAGDYRNFCHNCSTEYWRDSGKIYNAPKASTTRSKGISESWNNPDVAAKRAQRHNVKVGDAVYRSVLEAFKSLHLPVGQHIKFRMALKAAKSLEFKIGDKVFNFSIVE